MASSAARDRILRAATAASSTSDPLTRPAAEALAKTLRLVADPTRLQLLSMINGSPGQEVTVGELTRYLGLRQPTISHHLRLMYEDGLLDREQRGRHVWYSIAKDRRDAIADLLR
jgi:ArsR family transcriptional regulator, arsenate/arsenite/antimonite-responsive transcriptional repressor